MKLCSWCDERGLHAEYHMTGPYDGKVFYVPHGSTDSVPRERLRTLRQSYPARPWLFLLWWWFVFAVGEATWWWFADFSSLEPRGIGAAAGVMVVGGWAIVMMVAWCWYDWCCICTKRLSSGDHRRCEEIMRAELACYDAMGSWRGGKG